MKLLQESDSAKERASIDKALLAVSGRCGAACIPHLRPLTQSSNNDLHMIGLHAMAIIGGFDALAAVTSAIENAAPAVQDEAMRILSNWPSNWPQDTAAAEALLTLARSDRKVSHKVLALRGYLQYVRGSNQLGAEQKLSLIHISEPTRPY